uniref:Uncharacterized protein n=1 Tax=Rhizophora mucronata TaxID=61149 RepID=A0A2P2PEN8_RHIMU
MWKAQFYSFYFRFPKISSW